PFTRPTATPSRYTTLFRSCNGGNAVVTGSADGGTPGYTGTGTFNHAAGTYSYTVTESNSCTATTTGTITQPSAVTATSSNTAILDRSSKPVMSSNVEIGTA